MSIVVCLLTIAWQPRQLFLLFQWLLWSDSESTDMIIMTLDYKHQTCLMLLSAVHQASDWITFPKNIIMIGNEYFSPVR